MSLPVDRGRRQLHKRDARASIRVLARAGISTAKLEQDFGGSLATIRRIIRNTYAEMDNEEEDLAIALKSGLPAFKARWSEIAAATRAQIKNEPDAQIAPIRLLHQRGGDAPPVPDFLLHFLEGIGSRMRQFYEPLKAAGMDKATLHHLGSVDHDMLDAALQELQKANTDLKLTAIDWALFKAAVKKLKQVIQLD
ncbi:hypothetical protein HMN09_01190700 [Mycena chlorophos]|uniref:Uncharacterized protein n=1 Tax=Mycena chlorophos TaxID=658473 RepID=A0A8H6S9S6_MYCCL|nr:hypothetical protein HMN09_01190700 [Mycena chlorophos]